ncbi:MAG: ADP-ribosylglycohydrolase family protein, partial [Pseudomonadota bacterium]
MTATSSDTRRAAVLGALVADAAALGLHWLYDQDRARELGGVSPEFLATSASDFEGFPAYFAHPKKRVGDCSQYGEQAMVMLQSLAATGGQYQKADYEDRFRAVFGYGGDYIGYIDHPTRDTLDNLAHAEANALATAKALPFTGSANDQHTLITKVMANVKQASGGDVHTAVEAAVRRTHDDPDMLAYARQLTDALLSISGFSGADDEQLPAVAKLPPLIAVGGEAGDIDEQVESAVRVTNHNDLAVEAGQTYKVLLQHAIESRDLAASFRAALDASGARFKPLLESVQSRLADSSLDVIRDIGMSCQLVYGMPGSAHVLMTTRSFSEAVRLNVLAGGDSCGRAMIIGAVAG